MEEERTPGRSPKERTGGPSEQRLALALRRARTAGLMSAYESWRRGRVARRLAGARALPLAGCQAHLHLGHLHSGFGRGVRTPRELLEHDPEACCFFYHEG